MLDWLTAAFDWLCSEAAFNQCLVLTGTLAGSISGIRLASAKRFDWFGAYIVGLATALGGGTTRDILLGQPVFWLRDPMYLFVTFAALVAVGVFGRHLISQDLTWFIFDTIGLGVFTVMGIEKTLHLGYSWWAAVAMGTVTGAGGGIMRDILINVEPLIFRKEIYALCCVAGAVVFCVCDEIFGLDWRVCAVLGGTTVVVMRLLAVKYRLSLPSLHSRNLEGVTRHGSQARK